MGKSTSSWSGNITRYWNWLDCHISYHTKPKVSIISRILFAFAPLTVAATWCVLETGPVFASCEIENRKKWFSQIWKSQFRTPTVTKLPCAVCVCNGEDGWCTTGRQDGNKVRISKVKVIFEELQTRCDVMQPLQNALLGPNNESNKCN